MSGNGKTLVIRNGTLIDGTGDAASQNDAVVIEGNRISSVGQLPPGLNLEDTGKVETIDAEGKWVMPGLIDGHCHLSFGFPSVSSTKFPQRSRHRQPGLQRHPRRPQRPDRAALRRHQHLHPRRHLVHRGGSARRHQRRAGRGAAPLHRRPVHCHLWKHRRSPSRRGWVRRSISWAY